MRDRAVEIKPIALIVNPEAARKKWQRKAGVRHLIERSLGREIYVVSGTRDNTVRLTTEIAPRVKTVVAVGGDGTIADVLEGLAKSGRLPEVFLGIIPFGSGNAFRRAFGIPKKIKEAIALIQEGYFRQVDLVRFEERVAGFISVGATAAITEEKNRHPLAGFWGHVLAGRKLLSLKPRPWQVELEEGLDASGRPFNRLELELPVLDAVIAKTNYFGYSWLIAPFARPDDGWLDITFFEMSGSRYVLSLPSIYFGLKQRKLRHFKARRITIRGEDLPVQYNGEFLGRREAITFEVWPRSLRLICPPAL